MEFFFLFLQETKTFFKADCEKLAGRFVKQKASADNFVALYRSAQKTKEFKSGRGGVSREKYYVRQRWVHELACWSIDVHIQFIT